MIETNNKGGKQSHIGSGFHKGFPAEGVLEVAKVINEGAEKYDINNWRLISAGEHYNHALEHLMRLGDPNDPGHEDHAAHAACRMLMMLAVRNKDQKYEWQVVPTPTPPAQSAFSTSLHLQSGKSALPQFNLNLGQRNNVIQGHGCFGIQ